MLQFRFNRLNHSRRSTASAILFAATWGLLPGCGGAGPVDSTGVDAGAGGSFSSGGSSPGFPDTATGGQPTNTTGGAPGVGSGGAPGSGGMALSSCTDTSSFSASVTGRWGTASIPTTNPAKTYLFSANWWDQYNGEVATINGIGFSISDNSAAVPAPSHPGWPMGFPSIRIGSYGGIDTLGSNLPKKVSDVNSLPTLIETNGYEVAPTAHNVSYDVWFTSTDAKLAADQYTPGAGGAYIMVWLYDVTTVTPRGQKLVTNHTVAGTPGTWDIWVDSGNPACISYVHNQPGDDLAFDLKNFMTDTSEHAFKDGGGRLLFSNDMFLSVVFAGFEVWRGGPALELKKWCAEVN